MPAATENSTRQGQAQADFELAARICMRARAQVNKDGALVERRPGDCCFLFAYEVGRHLYAKKKKISGFNLTLLLLIFSLA